MNRDELKALHQRIVIGPLFTVSMLWLGVAAILDALENRAAAIIFIIFGAMFLITYVYLNALVTKDCKKFKNGPERL